MSASTKLRSSSLPAKWLALLCLCASTISPARALPVFMADNHAETFGWITRTFDPAKPATLVLIDAHSDASAGERSEEMREQLSRVPDHEVRIALVEKWRTTHRLQAFNWIEPLMPRPLDQVHWFTPCDDIDVAGLNGEAVRLLDGRLEVEPRSAGSFTNRWHTSSLPTFNPWKPGNHPVILAIDLDTFAEMDSPDGEKAFHEVWRKAMEIPELKGVAFAISRPWLKDEEQSNRIVSMALRTIRSTRGTTLELDASIDDRPDDSAKAEGHRHEGVGIPRWDLASASDAVKAELRLFGDSLSITDRKRHWDISAFPQPALISPDSGEIDVDGVWRFPLGKEPILRLRPPTGATGRVRWLKLQSVSPAYDLLPATGLGKGFSGSYDRHIYDDSSIIGESQDFLLDPAAWRSVSGGTFRIAAEYETPSGWLPSHPIEIRVHSGDGFHGALSECFGMPYVFGIAGVSDHNLSGVETGWGSDCSNLLIHAWRRCGIPLSWGDPGRLRRQLVTKQEKVDFSSPPAITAEEIRRGIAIDFGQHVAALWEDRPPIGLLDPGDLVIHHLGGRPEIIPLGTLTSSRPSFALRVPPEDSGISISFAGDIVLAGEDHTIIPGLKKHGTSLLVANLEGIPSLRDPDHKPRFDFRFPPDRLESLKELGVSAVSLANNHAMDAGPEGLMDGIDSLNRANIPFCGAGATEQEACKPWITEQDGQKIAVFGISIVGGGAAGSTTPGIAMLPHHQHLLETNLRAVKQSGARIIILLHGGDEYTEKVNDDQRHWARWLVARGASVIAGSHPHVIQREEIHGGALILHSLGNAVYPLSLKGADSGKIRIVTLPGGRR